MSQNRIRSWPDWFIALALFAAALAVYNATLTPSLSYRSPDGNELATIPYVLGLAHSTGYPLYTWLGKLFTLAPIGDVAHRPPFAPFTRLSQAPAPCCRLVCQFSLSSLLSQYSSPTNEL